MIEHQENIYAWLTGWLSIICWIIVFTPQIYENYRNKNGDSLSLWFLWIWLLGDIFNIAGVLLEHLLPTMLFLAIYYTVADMILIFQVIYYRHVHRENSLSEEYERLLSHARDAGDQPTEQEEDAITPIVEPTPEPEPDSRDNCTRDILYPIFIIVFLFASTIGSIITIEKIGIAQYLGWCSAVLYIGSRIPQISKNNRNQSTQGLSAYMFIFSIAGNSFYCASIFLQSIERDFLLQNLPWLLGSGGTLLLDFFIGTQFIVFSRTVDKGKGPARLEDGVINEQ